jgi:predicted RNA binding protein YcfA (HicA-like mRNA interferase family)
MFPIELYWPGIHNSSSERGLSSTIVVPRHGVVLAPKTIKSIISQAEEAIPPRGMR